MKKLISVLLVLVFVLSFMPFTAKAGTYEPMASIQLKVNSESFSIDGFDLKFSPSGSKPILINNVVYVPVREIIETVGGVVSWSSNGSKASISMSGNVIDFYINNCNAKVNNGNVQISYNEKIAPLIINSRTLVPLEFLVNNLAGQLSEDAATHSFNVTFKKPLIQVIDATGRKVMVPKKIHKIVSLYPMLTQLLFTVQSEDALIATPKGKVVNSVNFVKVFPQAKDLPDASSYTAPNVETILSYKPDLVITTFQTQISKLEEVGIPVVLLNLESPALMLKSIQFLGNILGKEDVARQSLIYFNEKLNYIKSKTSNINKKSTVYIAGSNIFMTFGGDFYQTFSIELAGAENVSKDLKGGKVAISAEQILLWNPDYIILTSYCSDSIEDVLNNPKLYGLKAIKNKKVFRMPSYILAYDLPAPESILGIMWLSNMIYPEIVNFDIAKEGRDFYKTIYNFDIQDADLKTIIGG